MPPRAVFIAGSGDHQRGKGRIAPTELHQSPQVLTAEPACFHLHGPLSPSSLKHGINLQRLFPPIGDALALIDGKCQAGILDPAAESLRFLLAIWSAVRMQGRKQAIVERDEFGRDSR